MKLIWFASFIAFAAAKWPALTVPESELSGKVNLKAIDDVPASFDCAMRKLAYSFGQQALPRFGNFESLFYALGLNDDCNVSVPDFDTVALPVFKTDMSKTNFFVDFNAGHDGNDGSIAAPFKTINAAVKAVEGQADATLNLRGGTHYLTETVQFSDKHKGLTIQNYNGENAVISGGQLLKVNWQPYNTSSAASSSSAPVSKSLATWTETDNVNYVYGSKNDNITFFDLGHFTQWQDCQSACQNFKNCHAYTWHDKNQGSYANMCIGRCDGRYEYRAQSGHYSGHDDQAKPIGPTPPPAPAAPNMYVADLSGQGIADMPGLQFNGMRVTRARYPNGNVETTIPDARVSGGEANWQSPDLSEQGKQTYVEDDNPADWRNFTHFGFQKYMVGIGGPCDIYDPPVSYWCSQHPSGGGAFAFRAPRGLWPKDKSTLPNAPYKDVSGMIVNVWRPSRWANWMFDVKDFDASSFNITFNKGGFQGARGNNEGSDFFVENVFEEFDYQNEFFYDKTAQKLYYFHNGTGAPPTDAEFVTPQLKMLFNLTSSRFSPIRDVTVQGITFTAAAYTYMDPHGVPSGGDWALDRVSAVFLEGTESVVIDQCNFTRLDGNAVMISGYNRNATVTNSEFSWLGGNAMASWGYTNETNGLQGFDGTDGNHPRYNTIVGNLAREVGLYEKQSSFYFQAKTAQSYLLGNVFFNGPRAGINFNDGFGGSDELAHNLIFSTCRESGDHGPFNSWDRQPFLTTVRDGTPSVHPGWREIHHNFVVDNYNPQEAIDNDDGSCFYKTHDNFLVYGSQGEKNDFGGNSNYHFNNVYGYIGRAIGITTQDPGFQDAFYNNTVVMTGTDVGNYACSGSGKTIMHDNSFYSPTGNVTGCGVSPPDQPNVTVGAIPSDDVVIGWAKAVLGMN